LGMGESAVRGAPAVEAVQQAFKSFYSQMNKWSRFGFIFLALGLAFPIFYDFIVGFINGLLKNV
ncbi:hypothetical protein, partial [Streptomyces sp. NPDC005012]|uniref:hypothetical protein n=1 Tax=Streptomyces sp. NPDC005012 TaxID=3154558 RepID=UPI0033BCB1CA